MEKLYDDASWNCCKTSIIIISFKIWVTSTTMSRVVKRLLEHFDMTKLLSEETTHEWFEISKEFKPPY
jgi:hypothetical protein